ncbi:MAG: bifunctional aldolase/short-chain dehydrogenase [Magnetococcales bacterium]|nr:bifunctional aldolase/short-chain dehydrogenase [Magnetococcales bacterium]
MKNRWSQESLAQWSQNRGFAPDNDLSLRIYSSRLLGQEAELVLHGGGNTSVKSVHTNLFGVQVPALYIKASGQNLATIDVDGLTGVDLNGLATLQGLTTLDTDDMVNALRCHQFDSLAPTPSIETLLHVFLPSKYIDHSHADALLTLSNQKGGADLVAQVLGESVIVLPYIHPGFELAKAAANAYAAQPTAIGMVLMKHGLITWGETAQQAYDRHIDLVNRVERFLSRPISSTAGHSATIDVDSARNRYRQLAPILRGALACPNGNRDLPHKRFFLRSLINPETVALLANEANKNWLLTSPLTSDHLIRTKPLGVWIASTERIPEAIADYRRAYAEYFNRHAQTGQKSHDSTPRVIFIAGVGVICAGESGAEAERVRDITRQTLAVKQTIAAMGTYEGLTESEQFAMEYFSLQQAKIDRSQQLLLAGSITLITGAAGAIGSGLCRVILEQGGHVAASDLAGEPLNTLVGELNRAFPDRILAVAMDVGDPDQVAEGVAQVVENWGGIDTVVLNAGLAHVSSLEEMKIASFNRLQRVNVEGTLNVLSQTAQLLKRQGTGGDIVLISTKNVFAPGANFGAYSATKAAAHQLARIASLELAPSDIRVNMVAPDAVFSEGERKSGLWAEVGPDRMKARGLDEAGLEAYYQNRNLLKSAVTARHVANAVLYFITRQSPTTGATLPVDGGLPDATPR